MSAGKHKYLTLKVRQSYEVMDPPGWMKSAVYNYAARSGKSFSVCKLAPRTKEPAIVIRRTA